MKRIEPETVWQRLAREGKCKVGTQEWEDFVPPQLSRPVPIEKILADLRGDRVGGLPQS